MKAAGVFVAGVGAGVFIVASFALCIPGISETGKKKARMAFMTGVALIAGGILFLAEAK